jgi:hypothetical protein
VPPWNEAGSVQEGWCSPPQRIGLRLLNPEVPRSQRLELAEHVAGWLRTLSGREFPVHLYSIAHALGVASIRLADLVEDGRVIYEEERLIIELCRSRSPHRRRFTLAHELAHIALARPGSLRETKRRELPRDSTAEERLCDDIAGALLIPQEAAQYHAGEPLSLAIIRQLADKAQVSRAAAAARIAELTGKTSMLIRLHERGGDWIPISIVARPLGLRGQLRLSNEGVGLLSSLKAQGKGDEDVWLSLTLRFDNRIFWCRSNISRRRNGILMLITSLHSQ